MAEANGSRRTSTIPTVVFSDVDGTILNADHCVTAATACAAHELLARSIPLVLVSARMPEALAAIRQDLGCNGPTVCYSGAYVIDGQGHELLSHPIALERALTIRDFVRRELPTLTVMAYGFHSWIVSDRSDPRVHREETVVGVEATEGSLEACAPAGGLHKFLLVGEPDDVERAEREVGQAFPDLNVVRSSPILCEVMDKQASKTEGITKVCEYLGTNLQSVLAIGDGRNDMDMLSAVYESWAMANAPEEVKAIARHVTSFDNNHDGFAQTIISVLKGGVELVED